MAQMTKICMSALCSTLLSTGIAFPQTSVEVGAAATPAAAAVAYVYVGTTNGVYLYDAASNGSLSMVPSSPRAINGVAIGSTHTYFLSLDPSDLHAYTLAPDGEIRSQSWFINTQSLAGSECGTAQGAVLDHAGQTVYVQLYPDKPVANDKEACAALQSFNLSSTGELSYLGTTEFATETETGLNTSYTTLVKLDGNGGRAYSASYDHDCNVITWEFDRESSGAMLLNTSEYLKVPSTPLDWQWSPWVVTSDRTNHMAIAMTGQSGEFSPCGDTPHLTQLASFTVASDGNLATANTRGKMPTPKVNPEVLNMAPSGELLAVGGTEAYTGVEGTQTPGLQVFHFNGANPITAYSKPLTSDPIDQIHWDNDNHLFALSDSTHKLYVYTVTPGSITAAAGSPYTMPATPNALAVVPVSCSAPATDGVHICTPANTSSITSPVLVNASAKVSGTFARMELWVDGIKKYTTASIPLSTTVNLAAGKHRFGVFAVNTAGQKWETAVNATVF